MRRSILGLIVVMAVVGCGGPKKPSKTVEESCSKQWDLGSGSVDDIERLAPDLVGSRFKLQTMAEAELPDGAMIRPRTNYTFEIKMPPVKEAQVRALRSRVKGATNWVMLIPGECHRLVATKSCESGRPKMIVTADGVVPCVDGRGIEGVEITADLRTTTIERMAPLRAIPLPPLKPVRVRAIPKEVPVFLGAGSKPNTLRTTTTFLHVTEEETLALASSEEPVGYFAEQAYRAVRNPSPGFEERVAQARIQAVKAYLPKVRSPKDVLDVMVYGGEAFVTLPGNDDVRPLFVGHLAELLDAAAADPSKHGFASLLPIFRLYEKLAGSPPAEALAKLEQSYGPSMSQEDEKDQMTFLHVFPASGFGGAIRAAQAERKQAADAASEAKEKEWRKADLWDTLKTEGDQLAQLKHKIAYATNHFSDTRRTRRGVKNMQLHYAAIVKDSFCPAKREFVKLTSAAEFTKRWQAHCKDEPPTIWGVSGNEVPLTAECRAAFSSAC